METQAEGPQVGRSATTTPRGNGGALEGSGAVAAILSGVRGTLLVSVDEGHQAPIKIAGVEQRDANGRPVQKWVRPRVNLAVAALGERASGIVLTRAEQLDTLLLLCASASDVQRVRAAFEGGRVEHGAPDRKNY